MSTTPEREEVDPTSARTEATAGTQAARAGSDIGEDPSTIDMTEDAVDMSVEDDTPAAPDIDKSPLPTGIWILLTLTLMTIAGAGLHFIQSVFAPVFFALTLVLALRPIGRKLIQKGMPTWLAATATITVLVFMLLTGVGILVWSLTPVPETLMGYSTEFENMVNNVLAFAQEKGMETQDLQTYIDQINFNSIVSWAWTMVDSLSSLTGLVSIIMVALFFVTIDTMVMKSRVRVLETSHSNLAQALAGFEGRVRQYWIVSTVFGLIVAIIDAVVLSWMGVPLAWTWGVWAFVTNYIPNIGFILGVIPPMLMALLDQGWQTMVWVAVLYSVINVVIQTFIQPKFTGDAVGLSPTVTFLSLIVWTAIIGIFGSVLAVPLTLFFKALLVDSDPRTRWIDVFLISEPETERRRREGLYDPNSDAEDKFREFANPFEGIGKKEKSATSAKDGKAHAGKSQRGKLSGLTRQIKAPKRTGGTKG